MIARALLLPALLAAALLLPAARAAEAAPKPAGADAKPADARVTIPVGGMTCGGCVSNITGKLQQVPGVKAVEVSLEKKRAFVTFDAAKVSATALVEVVREAGFEPGAPVVE